MTRGGRSSADRTLIKPDSRGAEPPGAVPLPTALALIAIMAGAIQKKVFEWHIGFWGDKTYGWHYDLTYLVANLVILTTGGGRLVLLG